MELSKFKMDGKVIDVKDAIARQKADNATQNIGDMNNLHTGDNSSLVNAINSAYNHGGGGGGGGGTSDDVWYPTVSIEGDISWIKSDTDVPPTPTNIKGEQGEQGIQGQPGKPGVGGFTPIGTVIDIMRNTAPDYFLKCDGSTYNIADYPDLAQLFEDEFGSKNYFGGDGTTTFGVPTANQICTANNLAKWYIAYQDVVIDVAGAVYYNDLYERPVEADMLDMDAICNPLPSEDDTTYTYNGFNNTLLMNSVDDANENIIDNLSVTEVNI